VQANPKIQTSGRRLAASRCAASRCAAVLVAVGVTVCLTAAAQAQSAWIVRTAADSLFVVRAEADAEAARLALTRLAADGWVAARVDSVSPGTLHVSLGNPPILSALDVVGAEVIPPRDLTARWRTRPGAPYAPDSLAADLRDGLDRYLRLGYASAVLTPRVSFDSDGVRVRVRLDVTEGPPARVSGVELVGARRPSRAFASRVAMVPAGTALAEVDAVQVRERLAETGLFAEVGAPQLAREVSGEVVVRVPVREAPPGVFDLVLGYLPPSGGGRGQVVGSGQIDVRNLFGGGRTARVALVRNPGLVSSLDLSVTDPFVLGLPVGLGVRFAGYGRDSTFSRQALRADGTLRAVAGTSVFLSTSVESVAPGAFGARLVDGVARVRRSSAVFAGAGVAFRRLNAIEAPRRGVSLRVEVEQGWLERASSDTLGSPLRREARSRLAAEVRGFVPLLARQTLVLGGDLRLVARPGGAAADPLDEGELFRIGGAASLRGYDEEALLGQTVGRALAEVRFGLDAASYAFAFADLGFTRGPSPGGEGALHPGYGAGARLRTAAGPLTVTYALNPALSVGRGKLHLGLRVGL
jgi:outer membrane protein assembly factor BamA